MNFYKQEVGDSTLFISKHPNAWMHVDKADADKLDGLFRGNSRALKAKLDSIAQVERLVQKENLALYPVIKLTNRCNLTCTHCYIESPESMRRGKYDLEFDEAKRFIDYVTSLGDELGQPTKTLQLFGGEPTLNKEFAEILTYARSKNLLVRVSTNAANIKQFQSGEFDHFFEDRQIEWRVSLESHIKEVNDQIRPRSFERIVSNVEYMAKRGAFISIKTVVGPYNYKTYIDTAYFARAIGATQYLYSALSPTGAAARMKLIDRVTTRMINEKMFAAVEADHSLAKFIRPSPLARYLKLIYTKDAGVLPRVQYFVNHDGKICPQDTLYEFPRFHFGDVSTGDYGFDRLTKYQSELEEPVVCSSCPVSHYCPRADYANMADSEQPGHEEFFVCDDIRDVVFYLMSLGRRGLDLTNLIFNEN
jgi:MoaA/NifB/PqqE/SkfB family radical SAM enzyme